MTIAAILILLVVVSILSAVLGLFKHLLKLALVGAVVIALLSAAGIMI